MTATDLVKRPLGGARVLVAEGDPDGSVALTAVLRLNGVGSSRVDLQACKLEYSIVSPK